MDESKRPTWIASWPVPAAEPPPIGPAAPVTVNDSSHPWDGRDGWVLRRPETTPGWTVGFNPVGPGSLDPAGYEETGTFREDQLQRREVGA